MQVLKVCQGDRHRKMQTNACNQSSNNGGGLDTVGTAFAYLFAFSKTTIQSKHSLRQSRTGNSHSNRKAKVEQGWHRDTSAGLHN